MYNVSYVMVVLEQPDSRLKFHGIGVIVGKQKPENDKQEYNDFQMSTIGF